MELIPSFRVDHKRIIPGVYVSRVDTIGSEHVTTYDVRMKLPNAEPAVHPNAMHTIEHVIATYLRNDPFWKDEVIYWGPMGCLTGCYLILKGTRSSEEVLPLVISAFEFCAGFEGAIPGADADSCGNYILQDLNMAKYEAANYVRKLKENPGLVYPAMNK